MGEVALVVPNPTTQLHVVRCKCGGVYAIAEHVRAYCEEHRTIWHCPYCQTGWGFAYLGPQTKLEKERDAALERARRLEEEVAHQRGRVTQRDRSIRAIRGHATRVRKRIANGVCPCCRRSFENLARHMKGQHPGYAKTEVGA